MPLYLVQHGKCHDAKTDPRRHLTEAGLAAVERIADVAKGYRIDVARIEHSNKARARETAKRIATYLRPKEGVGVRDGIGPKDDVVACAAGLDPKAKLMLVSHLPFLGRLTAYLTVGDTQKRPFRFQNGGIVCLDRDPDGSWSIRWTLMPEIG